MIVSTAGSVQEAAAELAEAPSPVVVIPVHDSYDDAIRCVESVLRHKPAGTGVLVIDDAGCDRRLTRALEARADQFGHRLVILVHRDNRGFVKSCNEAFEVTAGRDVVLVV